MKFQTKMHEVDAISVDRLTKTALQGFEKLPKWVISSIELGNLYFGHHAVVVRNDSGLVEAQIGDVLILNSLKQIEAMSKKDFFDRYEDMWDKNNNSIV